MNTPRRPRVLVMAEAANPEWTSVPLIGWSLGQALRAVADVHLVTQIRNREAILRAGLIEGEEFTAIDSEAVAAPAWRAAQRLGFARGAGWTILAAVNALTYPHFERLAWRRFGPDLAAGRFDLVHRVTPLSPVVNSPLAPRLRRLGVPFVLGPLNGGVPWPPGFGAAMRREREWLSKLRGAHRLLPGHRATWRAEALLIGSRHTLGMVAPQHRGRCIYLPENGIDPDRFPFPPPRTPDGPLRACFIGRLVPYKGPDMALEAAAPLLRAGRMRLDIIGDGPMRPALEAQARDFGDSVTFHGWVPHAQLHALAGQAEVLAFPSIREFGGGAVLEAMALGLAPVVVDYAGPAELVTPATGIKVPLGRRPEIVAGTRAALEGLAADRARAAALGRAAHARVAELFTWPRKAAQIAEVYDWVLGRRPDRPEPVPPQGPLSGV